LSICSSQDTAEQAYTAVPARTSIVVLQRKRGAASKGREAAHQREKIWGGAPEGIQIPAPVQTRLF
jgi:hypothetical protein